MYVRTCMQLEYNLFTVTIETANNTLTKLIPLRVQFREGPLLPEDATQPNSAVYRRGLHSPTVPCTGEAHTATTVPCTGEAHTAYTAQQCLVQERPTQPNSAVYRRGPHSPTVPCKEAQLYSCGTEWKDC
jgi:hypothetical protein